MAFAEKQRFGGVTALINTSRTIGRALRDRISNDLWRIANRSTPPFDLHNAESMIKTSNMLIDRFAALSGLSAENMVRGPAWRFFDMGRRLARALNICRITRNLAAPPSHQADFSIILDLCDSQIAYRSRYLTGPMADPVLDLVLLDPDNPRSLVFQVEAITKHMGHLPQLLEDGVPEVPVREVRAIGSFLQSASADEMDADALKDVELRLLSLSDAISTRYFLQYEKHGKSVQNSFLA